MLTGNSRIDGWGLIVVAVLNTTATISSIAAKDVGLAMVLTVATILVAGSGIVLILKTTHQKEKARELSRPQDAAN